MNRLFTPGIECTDPDSLQFCLRISDTEYWYCQPNIYHRDLFLDADTPARHILCRYLGYPDDFLRDMHTDAEVRAFASDRMLWKARSTSPISRNRSRKRCLLTTVINGRSSPAMPSATRSSAKTISSNIRSITETTSDRHIKPPNTEMTTPTDYEEQKRLNDTDPAHPCRLWMPQTLRPRTKSGHSVQP